jgi:hypothetical protein
LPFLISALHNQPTDVLRPVDETVVDLAGWVVPREHTWIGGTWFPSITQRFSAAPEEDAGYIGIAGLAMLVGFAITERHRRGTWLLLALIGTVALLSMGPVLRILGRPTITLPGTLLTRAPLLQHATAQRLPVYAALAEGVIAAVWLARARGPHVWVRWAIVALAALTVMPAASSSVFHAYGTTPGFFTSGDVYDQIHRDETVFSITERAGTELSWMAASDFWYRIPQGYVGPIPAAYQGESLFRGLAVNQRNPYVPTPEEFATWLGDRGVTAVLLDDDAAWKFTPVLDSVGLENVHQGDGVSVWRPGSAGYAPVDEAGVVVSGDLDHPGGELRRFSFPALDGGDRIVGPDGRPTLFTFVGPECTGCAEHLRPLDAFAAQHPEIRVIAVSSWDPARGNAATIEGLNLGFEVAEDPLGRMATASFGQRLPILDPPTPFSVLVGADGRVVSVS